MKTLITNTCLLFIIILLSLLVAFGRLKSKNKYMPNEVLFDSQYNKGTNRILCLYTYPQQCPEPYPDKHRLLQTEQNPLFY